MLSAVAALSKRRLHGSDFALLCFGNGESMTAGRLSDLVWHSTCYCCLQDIDIKYIDPTYMIRAIPTTTNDRIYCKVLGQGAVHGAFAGFTGCTVGLVNTHYVYLPIPVIIQVSNTDRPGQHPLCLVTNSSHYLCEQH